MHSKCKYLNANRLLNGDLTITLAIDNGCVSDLEELKDADLSLTLEAWKDQRSKKANRYFWKLCELMATALGTTKQEIHDIKLKQYGVFDDVTIHPDSIKRLLAGDLIDVIEELYSYENGLIEARVYYGSHTFNTKEMARLLDGMTQDATDIGIQTISDEELAYYLKYWKGV